MVNYGAYTQIIKDRVSALQAGTDYGLNPGRDGRCRCIFCTGDRDDTLRLYSGNRGAYCFRCHKVTDVIGLVMEITGQNFPQTVRDLNSQYGLGLPLDKPDPEKEKKAREAAEKRLKEQEEQRKKQMRLFEQYLDAYDAVRIMEWIVAHDGPKRPEDPFSWQYEVSAKYIDEMRNYRDRLYDQLYPINTK